jgi:hypothetical protein
MTPGSNTEAKKVAREIAEYMDTKGLPTLPTAIVGLTLMQRTVAQLISFNSNTFYSDSIEKAKEWLVR